MPSRYSFERGKYGIFPGTIISFARKIEGSNPDESQWIDYVPAGYLRCDGSVKKAEEYIELSQILGTGQDCKFKKDDIELDDDEFQLPDLGSKNIIAGSSSGRYDSLDIEDTSNGRFLPRAGIGVEIDLNQGSEIEVIYSGEFAVPSIPLNIADGRTFVSNLSSSLTPETVSIDGYLTHGHYGNYPQSFLTDPPRTDDGNCGTGEGNTCSTVGKDASPSIGDTQLDKIGPQTVGFGGSTSATEHSHQLTRSRVTRSTTQNTISTNLESSNISTLVNISQDNTIKIDDIVGKFILVEYLIKI
jgi:hypothetical protein